MKDAMDITEEDVCEFCQFDSEQCPYHGGVLDGEYLAYEDYEL